MHVGRSVERLVYGALFHIRPAHVTVHVKMNGITAETIRLTHVVKFNIGKAGENTLRRAIGRARTAHHYVRAKFIGAYLSAIATRETCLHSELARIELGRARRRRIK